MEPTQAPTPLPQPNPQQPLQIVGYQRVALTERALPSKYYSARRLVENDVVFDEEGADTAGEGVHRRLVSAADNTESCYAACRDFLAPANQYFLYNLYTDPNNGTRLCTCCTDFTGYRFVPVGVIVATCTTPRTLPYTFGTSPRVLVGSGKLLTYRIRFRSTDPVSALTGVKVDISLPPYVTVASTATLPLPERRNKASGAGIMSGGVVTWQNMTIAPKKSRIFRVRMHVAQNTPRATVLSFGCTLFQTNASPGGDPYCPMRMQDWTVTVK